MTTALATGEAQSPQKLDDVMLAMDIVDTLRHRERLVEMELGGEAREQALIRRLKEIYAAQGIDVPDDILKDGVKALEDKRFQYEAPKPGIAVSLAKIYIARDRWLKPLALVFGLAAFATATYEFGYAAPREARIAAEQVDLKETLPAGLASARDAGLALAADDGARARIETAYQDGIAAARKGEAGPARAALEVLARLKGDLEMDLTVRIVQRDDENSGVFRIRDDAPNVRNYYLIVEAVDAGGRVHALEIESEEDRSVERVAKWGVRVPEGVFNTVAADKQDDRIIENAVIGRKPRGALQPAYSTDGAGGAILKW